jgi:hypothetical protein
MLSLWHEDLFEKLMLDTLLFFLFKGENTLQHEWIILGSKLIKLTQEGNFDKPEVS